ncbi:MAG: hypothetical protein AAF598_13390 [Bacteroidota bacterium]
MNTSLSLLKEEIFTSTDQVSAEEWHTFQLLLTPTSYLKGEDVFPITNICKAVFFLSKGILASEYQTDEEFIINRFFRPKDLCSNLVSLLTGELANDRLFAVTNVEGVLIPANLLLDNYFHSDTIGLYFREKVLATLLADKHFMSIKTLSGVKPKLTFLQENYPEVILNTPWKHIANFMGITPSWLSRILKQQKE